MKRFGGMLVVVGLSSAVVGCVGADDAANNGVSDETLSRRCAYKSPTVEEAAVAEAKMDAEVPDREDSKPAGSVKVNVYFHVINNGTGAANGDVAEKLINDQLDVLNAAYSGKDSKGGFDTAYRFVNAGIDRTKNATWYTVTPDSSAEAAMKAALRKGGAADLNVYIANIGDGLLGWATFPSWYADDPKGDGVVILGDSLPGGSAAPYDLGDTLTHEVGHWLGLYHTFQGGCTPPGDYVKDTPRVASPNFGTPAEGSVDSCATPDNEGGVSTIRTDLVENFMDYTDDIAMYSFTKKQGIRMDRYWDKYRAH